MLNTVYMATKERHDVLTKASSTYLEVWERGHFNRVLFPCIFSFALNHVRDVLYSADHDKVRLLVS